ncbi:MAG: sigma-54-dependent Fis family transcriptional regulator [Pirellulaceae bacterium]|nr:MAG: sigma-54-dependent Fis family transcriptional regulator [Pirellulaceae bacterium]
MHESEQLAYLVIREGTKWTDVYRLVPGRRVTIGRAPTNQIVIKDDRCSRNHAELFQVQGRWTLRDLDSRNGTLVGGERIVGDYVLHPGDIVRIANCQLAFVHDISQAFREWGQPAGGERQSGDETVTDVVVDQDAAAVTQIVDRRQRARWFVTEAAEAEPEGAAARLCRLAFRMAGAHDVSTLTQRALEGLLESARIEAGAILLAPQSLGRLETAKQLDVVAVLTKGDIEYRRASDFLVQTVFREGEAVLARNVADDSLLSGRDSRGEIRTSGVICAPIRDGSRFWGIIHLYSTAPERMPDTDDLEFTLAVADNLALALANLERQQQLAADLSEKNDEIARLRLQLGSECELVGRSPAILKVQQQIARVAGTKATVLIRGESGVGKELVARAIHFASPRRKGPFVCLNCAALSETLLESELFGHERGAFTGATERKIGKFEAAHQGTLMLDEIGEMSPHLQAKFLRVLEGHPFERVGGSSPIRTDVRVIAATNRDLEKAVAEGKFRRDLYFRLHVVEIHVPPLRKRPEDIQELAQYFLARFNAEMGRRLRGFTPDALAHLRNYRWPGNVRELKNAIERAVVLARGEWIDVDDLPLSHLATTGDSSDALARPQSAGYVPLSLEEVEKRHILATLEATGWNKSRAAAILGIERSTLDRKLQRYQIRRTRNS